MIFFDLIHEKYASPVVMKEITSQTPFALDSFFSSAGSKASVHYSASLTSMTRHVAIPILLRIGYWYWLDIDGIEGIRIDRY